MLMNIFAALMATALWGFTFLGPLAIKPIGVLYLVIGRYAIFSFVSIFLLVVKRQELQKLSKKEICLALHLGIVGYIGFYALFAGSISLAGGVLPSIITGIMPAAISIGSNFLHREVAWKSLFIPVVITGLGLYIVNSQAIGTTDNLAGSSETILWGIILAFGACLSWTYFVIVNAFILKKAARPVDNGVWTAMIGIGAGLACLGLIPYAPASGPSPFSDLPTLEYFIGWCILLGLLGSWCASWLWNWAAKGLPTSLTGQIIAAETLFGVAFNLMWEGRWPTIFEIIGGLLVLGGVSYCVAIYNNRRRRKLEASMKPQTSNQT